MLPPSLSEVTGPLFGYDIIKANDFDLTKQHGDDPIRERIVVSGRVLDANARPVANTLVEIWQASVRGKFAHPDDTRDRPLEPGFKGFGRVPTDDNGGFRFTTIKPGRTGTAGGLQAPHIGVVLFMRGMLEHLVTRIDFAGDSSNAENPVLQSISPGRRDTLLARPMAGRHGTPRHPRVERDSAGQGRNGILRQLIATENFP